MSLTKKIIISVFLAVFVFSPVFSQDKKPAVSVKENVLDKAPGKEEARKQKDNRKASGQGFEEEDFKPKVEEESYGWLLFQVILILGFLAVGFYMFYRFVSQKTGMQISGQNVVQTLSSVPLGPGKYLHIVDVAGKVFMLGVTDNSINLITEIDDKDEKDRIRLLSSKSPSGQGKNFGDMFTENVTKVFDRINSLNKGKKEKKDVRTFEDHFEEEKFDVDYLEGQKSRLKKINGNHEE